MTLPGPWGREGRNKHVDIATLRGRAERAKGRRDAVKDRLDAVTQEIASLEDEEALCDMVVILFRQLLDREITDAVKAVERLQTEGLQAVFPDKDLSVRAEVEVQRGKVSVNLVTVEVDGGFTVEGSSLDSFGGSVLTFQSILMRVIVIFLRGMRPFLLLDESAPAFDSGYVVHMGHFLATLCKRLDMDMLLITHNPALVEAATRAYRIEKRGGEAHFQAMNPAQVER